MTVSSWSVQVGVFAHLSADPALAAMIGSPPRLYDHPPPEARFPFVTLGEARSGDLPGAEGAREHDIRLRVFSRYGGRREVKEIADILHTLLHDASFAVEGHRLVQCRFVFADVLRGGDPDGYQAVLRFRLVTEPAA